jgi:hypothetical protein
MSPRCHAEGCATDSLPELPFCLRHWQRCPSALQSDLWRYWRPAHSAGTSAPAPSADALRKAVAVVARAEEAP